MSLRGSMIALTALAALGACQANTGEDTGEDVPGSVASPTPETDDTVSILRPEIEQPEVPEPLEPLRTTVGFPDGGTGLDAAALEALQAVLASSQIELEGPIVLGGHTDSAGNDRANLLAGRKRAEAVRDWLVEQGVAEDRIEIITFGEQNPVEPNARPDGQPNEAGRAANRRVELEIPVVVVAEEGSAAPASVETGN